MELRGQQKGGRKEKDINTKGFKEREGLALKPGGNLKRSG